MPASLLGRSGEHYALEVAGDSMIEAGILDGDTVIIQRCDTAENGCVVVALVDDQEVTLKRLRRRGASIALEPANKAYETRIFGPDRVKVQGRLVASDAPFLTPALLRDVVAVDKTPIDFEAEARFVGEDQMTVA